jgi:hypothetical protein
VVERIKKLSKMQKIVFASICAAIILIIAICSITNSHHNKIDLADVYAIRVEGLDTQGKAKCELNKESLKTILIDKNIDAYRGNLFLDSMKCSLSKTENLKNGDKILLTITYDNTLAEQLNLSFKNTQKEIEISGLEKGKEVDVFRDLEVSYTGTSPDGKVSLINNSNDPFISLVTFESSQDIVANGDKIVVKAIYPEQEAISHKAIVKESEKSYIVSGLPEYVSKANQIDSKRLSDIKSMSDKVIEENLDISIPYFVNHLSDLNCDPVFTLGDTYSHKNIKLQKAYLYTVKDNPIAGGPMHNEVITLSSVDIIANGKTVGTAYILVNICDVIIKDGKLISTENNENNYGNYNSLEEAQEAAEDFYGSTNYNIEPINIQ